MEEGKSEGGNGRKESGRLARSSEGKEGKERKNGRMGGNEEIDFLPFLQLEASYESICKFLWSS